MSTSMPEAALAFLEGVVEGNVTRLRSASIISSFELPPAMGNQIFQSWKADTSARFLAPQSGGVRSLGNACSRQY